MRIFFASDVHGSERTFRKFLNAAPFYEADTLILGGDLTGKAILPIVRLPKQRYQARLLTDRVGEFGEDELPNFLRQVRDSGFYPYVGERAEIESMWQDHGQMNALFGELIRETLTGWLALAEDRLRPRGLRCFLMPGNDDMAVVDEVLADPPELVVNVARQRAWVDDKTEIVGLDYTNPTPWDSPREASEDKLAAMLDELFAKAESPRSCIANLHCPPVNTPLDQAPALTEDLKPVMFGGQVMTKSVGSTAIRTAIERYQPLLGLHGHVHESRGVTRIGDTWCLNPGSEYGEGILRGAVIEIRNGRVVDHRFTTG
jgi:Icc-related predicted phosphoesterase